MLFYLYRVPDRWGNPDRFTITSEQRAAHCEASCIAPSWIDAKQILGFELTPIQAEILKSRGR